MSQRWAVRLERKEIESAGKLRLVSGAEVCVHGDDIWVRGDQLDEPLARLLRRHPHARRHWVLPDGQLVSPGRLVPRGHLPPGPWVPLRDWLSVSLPPTTDVSRRAERVPVRLVPSTQERAASALLTDITRWYAYGCEAPQVRLRQWFFAVAADGRVIVRGAPLPPLPGRSYVEQDGIATMSGWTWSPAVSPQILREVLKLDGQDLALLHDDRTWERITSGAFVRATRSAIRLTLREAGDVWNNS